MTTRPERLARIERELAKITERQHRDAMRKTHLIAEATRLRCSLTRDEAVQYETLAALEQAAR